MGVATEVMKPAFHRSPVLWLGLFGLVFLGWVRGDARKATSSVYEYVRIDDVRVRSLPTDPVRYGAMYVNGVTLHEGALLLTYARVVEVKPHAKVIRGGTELHADGARGPVAGAGAGRAGPSGRGGSGEGAVFLAAGAAVGCDRGVRDGVGRLAGVALAEGDAGGAGGG